MTQIPDRRKNDEEHMKKWMKQAIQEWLDSKFAAFGRWSFYSIAAAALAALTYFIVTTNGFHPK